jgi:CubicO group peptidase (beta-lactamase class C family)
MLKYMQLNLTNETLAKAHKSIMPIGGKFESGLTWVIMPSSNHEEKIIWHNGGTGGFRSFAGMIKKENLAVVILSNAAISVDEIGILILDYLVDQKK